VSTVTAYTGTATSVGTQTNSTGAMETGPSVLAANWLANVQRRVRDSIIPDDKSQVQSGQWLTRDVANSAILFFQMASDVLPGEPYIYSSNGADLIAEFKSKFGVMTSVVSGPVITVYATVNGVQGEKHIDLRTASPKSLQDELNPLMIWLSSGKDGPSLGP
jgi:hypothetical protein